MVKKFLTATGSALSTLALTASVAFAQSGATIGVNAGNAGFRITDLGTLINGALRLVLGIVGLLVFIYLIWGGVEWLTAGGDKSKTESARTKITNAIIGLAIVASAFAVGAIISRFFGVNVGSTIEIPQGY